MYTITKAEAKHIATIRYLAETIWPIAYQSILSKTQLDYMLQKFYSEHALLHQINELNHTFYLVHDDENRDVAFASISNEENEKVKLQKLYVLPQLQGSGVGKLLLNCIIDEQKKKDKKQLYLNVNRHNKARFFYEKLGFKIVAEEDIDIGNNYFMNDFIMELNIA